MNIFMIAFLFLTILTVILIVVISNNYVIMTRLKKIEKVINKEETIKRLITKRMN